MRCPVIRKYHLTGTDLTVGTTVYEENADIWLDEGIATAVMESRPGRLTLIAGPYVPEQAPPDEADPPPIADLVPAPDDPATDPAVDPAGGSAPPGLSPSGAGDPPAPKTSAKAGTFPKAGKNTKGRKNAS